MLATLLVVRFMDPAAAGEPAGKRDRVAHQEVSQLLADLNADLYETRRQAVERLRELGTQPALQPVLAAEYRRLALEPETSLEVREALASLATALPIAESPPDQAAADAAPATDQQWAALFTMLDDRRYSARAAAAARLERLAATPEFAEPMLTELKRRLASPSLDSQSRRQLTALCERARGSWLLCKSCPSRLPQPSDAQIGDWIDEYTNPTNLMTSTAAAIHRTAAERELLDALCRDESVARVTRLLRERAAADNLDPAARAQLDSLLAWTHPAMVAEYWKLGQHMTIQHLLLGVPNQPAGAERASLFDRCDERVAHCVSGNSLSPGDYPVDVFFPHPTHADAQFHLVNLPTPRRRMAYEYLVRTDTKQRLAEITRKTLDRLLAERRVLSEREIVMLRSLDAKGISDFAGPYFLSVDDAAQSMQPGEEHPMASRHALVCLVLAQRGTHRALPGLMRAIEAKRFLPSTSEPEGRCAWIAALAVATRDPCPKVDDWLAQQLTGAEPLLPRDPAATIGASAAAILLAHHEAAPSLFGLEPIDDPSLRRGLADALADAARLGFQPAREDELMEPLPWTAYRFAGPPTTDEIRDWWNQRRRKVGSADGGIAAPVP
jgi:hypothetical protein